MKKFESYQKNKTEVLMTATPEKNKFLSRYKNYAKSATQTPEKIVHYVLHCRTENFAGEERKIKKIEIEW